MPERTTGIRKVIIKVESLITFILMSLVWIYMKLISPLKPQTCRFYPTCSQYTFDALMKYGFLKGSYLGLKRIISCHPFNPGGYYPVE